MCLVSLFLCDLLPFHYPQLALPRFNIIHRDAQLLGESPWDAPLAYVARNRYRNARPSSPSAPTGAMSVMRGVGGKIEIYAMRQIRSVDPPRRHLRGD